ncbi:MAG: hypothetical protein WBD28_01670 [Candidatus Zixiibacteriota bacterium]
MTPKRIALVKFMFISAIFWFVVYSSSVAGVLQKTTSKESTGKIDISEYFSKIDTLFVIHFHPTVQCSCCINVGNFARKGLEQFYAKPYNDSLVIFKEYDIDEDSSTAKKYGIFWSALGFEKFCGGEKEFKEIDSVWEFCEEKEKFLLNFKREIDEFIMRSKKAKSEYQNTKQDTVKLTDKKPENRYPQKKGWQRR